MTIAKKRVSQLKYLNIYIHGDSPQVHSLVGLALFYQIPAQMRICKCTNISAPDSSRSIDCCQCGNVANSSVANSQFPLRPITPLEIGIGNGNTSTLATFENAETAHIMSSGGLSPLGGGTGRTGILPVRKVATRRVDDERAGSPFSQYAPSRCPD